MVLEGILSIKAEELYRRLLDIGAIRGDCEVGADDPAVRELLEKHFAYWGTDGTELMPVAPRLAIEGSLLDVERRLAHGYESCLRALAAMPRMQRVYDRSSRSAEEDQRVRVVGEWEAAQLSIDLLETAHYEVLAFQILPNPSHPLGTTARMGQVPITCPEPDIAIVKRLRERGVRMRCIFANEFFNFPQARDAVERYIEQGIEVRAINALPTSMVVIDSRVAVLPLDTHAASRAVMFHGGPALDLLHTAFFMHWSRSVPLMAETSTGDDMPSETQTLILRLLAAGMKDESIARHLKVSLRTVRRNVTALAEKVGAPTRFALATIASERGWITSPVTKTPA